MDLSLRRLSFSAVFHSAWDYSFGTYAKLSEKLTFINPTISFSEACVRTK